MTTSKKTTSEIEWIELPPGEIQDVVALRALMNAAQAHKLASVPCMEKARAERPSRIILGYYLLPVVCFELLFTSIEQSLRLLFLVRFHIFPKNPNHDLHTLYRELQKRDEEICRYIIQEINSFGQIKNVKPISENELIDCLIRHGSSYVSIKYFNVDKKGKMDWSKSSRLSERDEDIFLCFASALICLNIEEMEKRGCGFSPAILLVPESGMTERLKALEKRALKELKTPSEIRASWLKALRELF